MKSKPEKLKKIIRTSAYLWLAMILSYVALVFIYAIFPQFPDVVAAIIAIGAFLVGSIAFAIGSFAFIRLSNKKTSKKRYRRWFKNLFYFSVFPVVLIKRRRQIDFIPKKRKSKPHLLAYKLSFWVASLIIILPVWLVIWASFGSVSYQLFLQQINVVDQNIPIAGTGSMYPTFPKGESKTLNELANETVADVKMRSYPSGFEMFGKKFFHYEIGRGDIVTFFNNKVAEINKEYYGDESGGLVKRVIGLPGDILEIRDGSIYVNGQPQLEPYVPQPRSTFGGEFLAECTDLTVPPGKLFVMGDNRKGSGDSRHDIGFIDYGDVTHVISWEDQQNSNLAKKWRDPTNDLKESARIKLNKTMFVKLINKERKKAGQHLLARQNFLDKSSDTRNKSKFKLAKPYLDTEKGYKLADSVTDAGYNSGFIVTEQGFPGYYTAKELAELIFDFEEYKDIKAAFLDPANEYIGLDVERGNIKGCPSQLINIHLLDEDY